MMKKVVAGAVVVLLLGAAGTFFWARSIFETDMVKHALASQLSKSLGQPVTIGSVKATVYPRVTISLRDVTIGEQREVTMQSIDVGTALGALLSRRIEHASLRVADAHVTLPLPDLHLGSAGAPDSADSSSPVTLVSVDRVELSNIDIVSHGRTLHGDIDLIPHGTNAVTISKIALTADAAAINATGEITNLEGPVGTLAVTAGNLDLDQLITFASDFAAGSTAPAGASTASTTPAAPTPAASTVGATAKTPADVTLTLTADRAAMSGVTLSKVTGTAKLQGDRLTIDPMSFGLFDGTYTGTIGAVLGAVPTFTWRAALKNVDMNAVTAFAGSPGTITGRLNGQIDIEGSGLDAAAAMKTARGTGAVTIVNGTVKNLALVKSAVAATSLDPQAVIAASQTAHDEPFSELGTSLSMAGGTASTPDLHFISPDIRLDAGGALRLDGSAVNLIGSVELSEALTKQANAAFVRVAAQNGKISLPITIRGNAGKYSLEIDTATVAKRAATAEVKSRAEQAVKGGLGRLLRK
ncbi:MAG: AsmA family protein [Vicinamibacterales bacterium]